MLWFPSGTFKEIAVPEYSRFTGSLTGAVVARPYAHGSKSERVAYFLVFDKGQARVPKDAKDVRMELKGENPFEQPTLKSLVDKRVRAAGGSWIGDLWRADSIEKLAPLSTKAKKKRPKRSPPRTK